MLYFCLRRSWFTENIIDTRTRVEILRNNFGIEKHFVFEDDAVIPSTEGPLIWKESVG